MSPLLLLFALLAGCGPAGSAAGDPAPGDPGVVEDPPPEPPPSPPVPVGSLVADPGSADGEVVLRFTAPTGPGGSRAAGYDVRHSVLPLIPAGHGFGDVADDAPVYAGTVAPGSPGSAETITLAGLEEAQTFEFAVRPRHADGTYGPWSNGGWGVSCTVPGDALPAVPTGAIHLGQANAGSTLSTAGAYYVLDEDVVATGNGFVIGARGITLDLNGHTLTFGTSGGVSTRGVHASGDRGPVTVVNGRVVHGAVVPGTTSTTFCVGVNFELTDGADARVTLRRLHVEVSGTGLEGPGWPDAAIRVKGRANFRPRISYCTVSCNYSGKTIAGVSPFNRNTGARGIYVVGTGPDIGGYEIDHCTILTTPHQGIVFEGGPPQGSPNKYLVHHNRLVDHRDPIALQGEGWLTNDYQLQVSMPLVSMFDNHVHTTHRGLYLDGIDGAAVDARVFYNQVDVTTGSNAEYGFGIATHGIKMEAPFSSRVFFNKSVVRSDAVNDVEGHPLNVDVRSFSSVTIGGVVGGPFRRLERVDGTIDHTATPGSVARGRVVEDTAGGTLLFIPTASSPPRAFAVGETIVGSTSGATAVVLSGPVANVDWQRDYVHDNHFKALRSGGTRQSVGVGFVTSKAVTDEYIYRNVFRAPNHFVQHDNSEIDNGPMRLNAFVRDPAGADATFERLFLSSGESLFPGEQRDALTTEDTTIVTHSATPLAWHVTRRWTLTVVVQDATGLPIPDAAVAVRNNAAALEWAATTDSRGVARGYVTRYRVEKPGSGQIGAVVDLGPFEVSVVQGDRTYTGLHPVEARPTGVLVNLDAPSAESDASPPPPPSDVRVHVLAPTRARIWWTAPADPSGILCYKLYDGTELLQVVEASDWVAFGLTPAREYESLGITAVDRGGNESSIAIVPKFATPPDDRGSGAPE